MTYQWDNPIPDSPSSRGPRLVVELRLPMRGERYPIADEVMIANSCHANWGESLPRYVIVEEEFPIP